MVSFTFWSLVLVAAASSEVVSEVADGSKDDSLFAKLALDDLLGDALSEGALALIIFGVASVMLSKFRAQRKPTKKDSRSHKGKLNSNEAFGEKVDALGRSTPSTPPWRRTEVSSQPKALASATSTASTRSPPGLSAAATRTPANREADVIATAVKNGQAKDLPMLLDAALSRLLAASTSQDAPEEIATGLLHSALRACASARCFNEAIALYDHMAGRIGEGNTGLWSVLLYCIVEAGAFRRCPSVFESLCKHGGASPHDFVNMVRCYAHLQDDQGLRDMLANFRNSGQTIDTFTWNRSLAACNVADSAVKLAEELAAADICPEGMDAVSYNTLMKYNARSGQSARCFELRKEMSSKGLQASEVTFGILLEACVGSNELEYARKVFDDLCSSGIRINVVHCTTFIKALVGANKLDEAARVVREMSSSAGVKPDLITYATVVKAYADCGKVSDALKILEQMMEQGVRPDEIIYNSVLTACSNFPMKIDFIMSTFEKLTSMGMKPSSTTFSILLKALAHTGAWTVSLQVINDAYENFKVHPEMRLYAQLAQSVVKARKWKFVMEVFDAMIKEAKRQSILVDANVVGRFIRSLLLAGGIETAVEVREAARRQGIAVNGNEERMLKNALAKRPMS